MVINDEIAGREWHKGEEDPMERINHKDSWVYGLNIIRRAIGQVTAQQSRIEILTA